MSAKPIVLLSIVPDGFDKNAVFGEDVEVIVSPGDFTQSSFKDWDRVIAIGTSHVPQLSRALIEKCPKLRLIARMGIGVDNIDQDAAADHGVCVCNVPDYGIEEVADTAFAHILCLFRQTVSFHSKVLSGSVFRKLEDVVNTAGASRRIRDKTLGLIGMGNIGLAVCERAKAFGFKIMIYDPFLHDGIDKAIGGITRAETIEDVIKNSDCISLHCPLLPATKHIINEERLRLFKKEGFIVNTARGGLIDEVALAKALKEGWLAGAALDVQAVEPFAYSDSPLNGVDGVILTPHSGWFSKESFDDVFYGAIAAIKHSIDCVDPSKLRYLLNKKVLKNDSALKDKWNITC